MLSAATTGKAVTQDELLRLIDEAAADGRPTLDLAGEELNELPPEIGKLTRLKTLVLGRRDKKNRKSLGNNLRVLLDEIGQLVELRSLFLHGDQLTELPESIGKLSKLRSLNLYSNQLKRITNAFKAGFDEDLKQSVKNPLAKILIQSCKGFLAVD